MIQLRFAPNGQKLLFIRSGDSDTEEAWLLPYPQGKSIPRRVLTHFPPPKKLTIGVSWMPDIAPAVRVHLECVSQLDLESNNPTAIVSCSWRCY